jgi:hypothetical protein
MLKRRRENWIVTAWSAGPVTVGWAESFELRDMRAYCSLCRSANPLANLRKMSIQEVTTPSEIIVGFMRSGTIAHALHVDCKAVLGPWITFASAETLEKALRYLGATDEQIAAIEQT